MWRCTSSPSKLDRLASAERNSTHLWPFFIPCLHKKSSTYSYHANTHSHILSLEQTLYLLKVFICFSLPLSYQRWAFSPYLATRKKLLINNNHHHLIHMSNSIVFSSLTILIIVLMKKLIPILQTYGFHIFLATCCVID